MAASTPDARGRRVGVLGGSFDPPHVGHLVVASEAHHQLRLDTMLLVPASSPPHKDRTDLSPAAVRLRLTEAAVADDPRLDVSDVEVERRLQYSVDTVVVLRELLGPAELWFVVGTDSLLALETWKQPHRLAATCRLAAAPRPGDDPQAVRDAARRYGDVTVLDSPQLDVSSSEIRRRVRGGRPISYLVPREVERSIDTLGLYRDPE